MYIINCKLKYFVLVLLLNYSIARGDVHVHHLLNPSIKFKDETNIKAKDETNIKGQLRDESQSDTDTADESHEENNSSSSNVAAFMDNPKPTIPDEKIPHGDEKNDGQPVKEDLWIIIKKRY